MAYFETMWQFKTRNFTVKWEVTDCDYLDLSFCETGETRENINSGLWQAFDSKVAVYYKGQEIGSSYLGQSIYENPSDFRDHIGCNSAGYGSYFSDMIREAIDEARQNMADRPRLRA